MERDEPRWRRTGHPHFPRAARVGGEWWVLRINSFPEHPLWTLFVGGRRRCDLDDEPEAWGSPYVEPSLLAPDEASEAIGPIADLTAYGSELGRPCDGPYCCG